MSEIKVNSIKGVSASTAAISIDNSSGTCTANITNNLSNRNLIINGAFQVAQRGTSSIGSNEYGSVDRIWHYYQDVDESPTFSQVDVASGTTPYTLGFRKAFRVTNGNQTSGAGVSDQIQFEYRLEAQDIANSGWNYTSSTSFLTLSYYIKSSVAQAFNLFIKTEDGTEKSMPLSTPSLTADTWTKVSFQIKGDSGISFNNDNGKGFSIGFQPFLGTNYTDNSITNGEWIAWSSGTRCRDITSTWYTTNDATLEITGLQLEVGSVATDFEHRSYAQELALCQRYYFHLVSGNDKLLGLGMNYGNPDFFAEVTFPVTMRAAPSLDITTGTNYYIMHQNNTYDQMASFAISRANTNKCNLYDSGSGGSAGKGGMLATYNASASVAFSAEL